MTEITEVAPGIRMIETPFQGVPLMLYLIEAGERLVLVDSGIAGTPAEHLLPLFERLGRGPDLLVNTHAHVDHFGGNAALRDAFPEMKIAAHRIDAPWIEDIRRHHAEFYMSMPDDWTFEDGGAALLELCGANTAVDIRLTTDEPLEIGGRSFRILQSAGHSPGHICLQEAATGIAITGDVALGWGPPTADGTPDAPAVVTDADAYLAGARAVLDLGAETYLTGHFGVLDCDAMKGLVADSEAYVAAYDRWTLEALEDGPQTLYEVARTIHAEMPSYEFGFHIHASAQALLERHLRHGRAATIMRGGRRHYRRTA